MICSLLEQQLQRGSDMKSSHRVMVADDLFQDTRPNRRALCRRGDVHGWPTTRSWSRANLILLLYWSNTDNLEHFGGVQGSMEQVIWKEYRFHFCCVYLGALVESLVVVWEPFLVGQILPLTLASHVRFRWSIAPRFRPRCDPPHKRVKLAQRNPQVR